ncbi:hypothetical protein RFI_22675 [Reticulomyxa filosa]|uniref:Uncharacterized protein n=1 Tax=Reticulomyxa filosa TaxID=46433 RepID=X6MLD4_RETFI|nr:hypothetical protein RFI_22675 [Reticulomyxa filosa]|eukprot:ETO14694.1 hypothetical protein RFI_22675 [Reticulomyxa filosa]
MQWQRPNIAAIDDKTLRNFIKADINELCKYLKSARLIRSQFLSKEFVMILEILHFNKSTVINKYLHFYLFIYFFFGAPFHVILKHTCYCPAHGMYGSGGQSVAFIEEVETMKDLIRCYCILQSQCKLEQTWDHFVMEWTNMQTEQHDVHNSSIVLSLHDQQLQLQEHDIIEEPRMFQSLCLQVFRSLNSETVHVATAQGDPNNEEKEGLACLTKHAHMCGQWLFGDNSELKRQHKPLNKYNFVHSNVFIDMLLQYYWEFNELQNCTKYVRKKALHIWKYIEFWLDQKQEIKDKELIDAAKSSDDNKRVIKQLVAFLYGFGEENYKWIQNNDGLYLYLIQVFATCDNYDRVLQFMPLNAPNNQAEVIFNIPGRKEILLSHCCFLDEWIEGLYSEPNPTGQTAATKPSFGTFDTTAIYPLNWLSVAEFMRNSPLEFLRLTMCKFEGKSSILTDSKVHWNSPLLQKDVCLRIIFPRHISIENVEQSELERILDYLFSERNALKKNAIEKARGQKQVEQHGKKVKMEVVNEDKEDGVDTESISLPSVSSKFIEELETEMIPNSQEKKKQSLTVWNFLHDQSLANGIISYYYHNEWNTRNLEDNTLEVAKQGSGKSHSKQQQAPCRHFKIPTYNIMEDRTNNHQFAIPRNFHYRLLHRYEYSSNMFFFRFRVSSMFGEIAVRLAQTPHDYLYQLKIIPDKSNNYLDRIVIEVQGEMHEEVIMCKGVSFDRICGKWFTLYFSNDSFFLLGEYIKDVQQLHTYIEKKNSYLQNIILCHKKVYERMNHLYWVGFCSEQEVTISSPDTDNSIMGSWMKWLELLDSNKIFSQIVRHKSEVLKMKQLRNKRFKLAYFYYNNKYTYTYTHICIYMVPQELIQRIDPYKHAFKNVLIDRIFAANNPSYGHLGDIIKHLDEDLRPLRPQFRIVPSSCCGYKQAIEINCEHMVTATVVNELIVTNNKLLQMFGDEFIVTKQVGYDCFQMDSQLWSFMFKHCQELLHISDILVNPGTNNLHSQFRHVNEVIRGHTLYNTHINSPNNHYISNDTGFNLNLFSHSVGKTDNANDYNHATPSAQKKDAIDITSCRYYNTCIHLDNLLLNLFVRSKEFGSKQQHQLNTANDHLINQNEDLATAASPKRKKLMGKKKIDVVLSRVEHELINDGETRVFRVHYQHPENLKKEVMIYTFEILRELNIELLQRLYHMRHARCQSCTVDYAWEEITEHKGRAQNGKTKTELELFEIDNAIDRLKKCPIWPYLTVVKSREGTIQTLNPNEVAYVYRGGKTSLTSNNALPMLHSFTQNGQLRRMIYYEIEIVSCGNSKNICMGASLPFSQKKEASFTAQTNSDQFDKTQNNNNSNNNNNDNTIDETYYNHNMTTDNNINCSLFRQVFQFPSSAQPGQRPFSWGLNGELGTLLDSNGADLQYGIPFKDSMIIGCAVYFRLPESKSPEYLTQLLNCKDMEEVQRMKLEDTCSVFFTYGGLALKLYPSQDAEVSLLSPDMLSQIYAVTSVGSEDCHLKFNFGPRFHFAYANDMFDAVFREAEISNQLKKGNSSVDIKSNAFSFSDTQRSSSIFKPNHFPNGGALPNIKVSVQSTHSEPLENENFLAPIEEEIMEQVIWIVLLLLIFQCKLDDNNDTTNESQNGSVKKNNDKMRITSEGNGNEEVWETNEQKLHVKYDALLNKALMCYYFYLKPLQERTAQELYELLIQFEVLNFATELIDVDTTGEEFCTWETTITEWLQSENLERKDLAHRYLQSKVSHKKIIQEFKDVMVEVCNKLQYARVIPQDKETILSVQHIPDAFKELAKEQNIQNQNALIRLWKIICQQRKLSTSVDELMQIKQEFFLDFLSFHMSSDNTIQLILELLDSWCCGENANERILSKFSGDFELKILLSGLIRSSKNPISAALQMSQFLIASKSKYPEIETEIEEVAQHVQIIAGGILDSVQSNRLALLALEASNSLDMAIDFNLASFLAHPRVQLLKEIIWTSSPEFILTTTSAETFRKRGSQLLAWAHAFCNDYKRLFTLESLTFLKHFLLGTRYHMSWFYSPIGKIQIEFFFYLMYLVCLVYIGQKQRDTTVYDQVVPFEHIFYICNFSFICVELKQVVSSGLNAYLSDHSNHIGVVIMSMYITMFGIRLSGATMAKCINTEIHSCVDQKLNVFYLLCWFILIIAVCCRICYMMLVFQNMGLIVKALTKMFIDASSVLSFLLLFTVGFALSMLIISSKNVSSYLTFNSSCRTVLLGIILKKTNKN